MLYVWQTELVVVFASCFKCLPLQIENKDIVFDKDSLTKSCHLSKSLFKKFYNHMNTYTFTIFFKLQ